MTEKKQIKLLSIFAGIALVFAIIYLFYSFRRMPDFFRFTAILQMVGWGAVAFALFTNRRDIVMPAGFGVVTLCSLIFLFKAFSFLHSVRLVRFVWFAWFCNLIGYAGLTFFSVAELTDYLPQFKGKFKKLWFVPVAILALALVGGFGPIAHDMRNYSIWMDSVFIIKNLVLGLSEIVGVLLAVLWIFNPNVLPYSAKKRNTSNTSTSEAYCDMVKHILLLLFTCGVWLLIWIYRMTGFTNAVKDEEERNPTNKLLLCLFVPFYLIYWTYKTAQRIDKLANGVGVSSDLSTLCLILAFFVPIIPPILMQDMMNTIVAAKPNTIETTKNEVASHTKETTLGAADELKKV